jgi:peptide/nickel transport system substrate-binding protein
MSEILCPECHAPNRSDARFCNECGYPLLGSAPRNGPQALNDDEQPAAAVTQAGKTLLGRYRIERELGRGGFGAVYKAWDINLQRPCAVKENLNTSAEARRQFAREATVLANLSHPNLPRVTDHFSIPDQGQYLVMDFVEGEDLASLLRRSEALPLEQCLGWMLQVADALIYMHNRQPPVLHRDIKPSNIRITPEGKAMLVDFGLVKMADPTLKTTLGARALTPGYAPPEQYGLGRTDARSDIYALGATLYKLVTRKEPLESVQRAAGEQLKPPGQLNPRLPPRLGLAIEKALALDPAQRFQSVAEFKDALQACLPSAAAPVLVSPSPAAISAAAVREVAPPVSRPVTAPKAAARRPPWLWIGLGGVAVLAILCLTLGGGTLALLGLRGDGTPTPPAATTPQSLGLQISETPAVSTQLPPAPPTNTPIPTLPVVHSKDPHTYVHINTGEPDTLDPALDYEVSGLQIIQNVYDTLVFFYRDDPNRLVPQLALEVPSRENGGISADGLTYTFKIRPGVTFHDGSPLTPQDVVYTFQRNILQGGSHSPMWLLTEPIFGVGVYDVAALIDPALIDDPAGLKKADPGRLLQVCQRLQQAIYADPASGVVIFRLAQPWAPFLVTLANGWGSIRSKAWTIANGGWDGDCATWQNYYGRSAADLNKTPLGAGAMGTGPYRLENWTPGEQIVLKANESYWRREPAWPDGPVGAPALKTVVIRYQREFDARLAALRNGETDSIHTANNTEWPELDRLTSAVCQLSDQQCQFSSNLLGPLEVIRGFPVASRDYDIFMNWQINARDGNDLIGSAKLDGKGVPPEFFSNIHVRRAFQFCFYYESYLQEVMLGEGERSFTVMLPGMIGYEADAPHYEYDPARCQDEFRQASFGGPSVWDVGFALKLPYPQGSLPRQKIAEIFQRELTRLNPKFKVEAAALESDDYWNRYAEDRLPIYTGSWIEDIHDPHNWVVPYTLVNFGSQLNLPADLTRRFKEIIDRGVAEQDPARRTQVYAEFNRLFYEQAPVILMYQSLGRRYQQRWVRGWYSNPILPGLYFYALSKD